MPPPFVIFPNDIYRNGRQVRRENFLTHLPPYNQTPKSNPFVSFENTSRSFGVCSLTEPKLKFARLVWIKGRKAISKASGPSSWSRGKFLNCVFNVLAPSLGNLMRPLLIYGTKVRIRCSLLFPAVWIISFHRTAMPTSLKCCWTVEAKKLWNTLVSIVTNGL